MKDGRKKLNKKVQMKGNDDRAGMKNIEDRKNIQEGSYRREQIIGSKK